MNMSPDKREALKRFTKLSTLAQAAEISTNYLSLIINGHRSAAPQLAERLAAAANALTLQTNYFIPSDFTQE
jgi:transcriptional regulator with XRE-family HTH domain